MDDKLELHQTSHTIQIMDGDMRVGHVTSGTAKYTNLNIVSETIEYPPKEEMILVNGKFKVIPELPRGLHMPLTDKAIMRSDGVNWHLVGLKVANTNTDPYEMTKIGKQKHKGLLEFMAFTPYPHQEALMEAMDSKDITKITLKKERN